MANLTREQHLAMAQCLKEAKKKLLSGNFFDIKSDKQIYVCWAVDDTDCDVISKALVKGWIRKQLKGEMFITGWLYLNKDIDLSTYEKRQAYRHAWVDHMIKVLES